MKKALFGLMLVTATGLMAPQSCWYNGEEFINPYYKSARENREILDEGIMTLHPDNPRHPSYQERHPEQTDTNPLHHMPFWYPGFEEDKARYDECLEKKADEFKNLEKKQPPIEM